MSKEDKAAAGKKIPRGVKILLGVLLVFAALAAAGAWYINAKLDLLSYNDGTVTSAGEIEADEDQDLDVTGLASSDGEMEMPEGSPFADENVLNILLIGTDERTEAVNDADAFTHLNQLDGTSDTTEFSENARADTLILVSLNIEEHTIKLVSIERGTGVPIMLDGYEGQYDWITHTFRYGGAKLTMDTVEDCFNVEVDHYVRVNFNSFVQIVDAVGGVDIEITELEAKALNWEVPSNSMLIVNHVEAGLNHFDGYTALQYARLRKIDSDWKRIERQRTVITAVLDAVKNASVTELDSLLNTVLPLVQTNFTKSEIAALLVQLPGFLGCEVEQLSVPLQGTYGVRTGMNDRSMYDPDWAVNIRALQDFLYNGQTAEEVIAATPETAAAEEAGESIYATRETAEEENPNAEYLEANLYTVDSSDGVDSSLWGEDDADVYLIGLSDGSDAEEQTALLESLYARGVRTVLVPNGPAAGALLDVYLQTGDETALSGYLLALPAADRDAAEEAWRALYARYPRALHAAGYGEDKFSAVVARAVTALAEDAYTSDEAFAETLAALQSGKKNEVLSAFREAMESAAHEMRSCFGDDYAVLRRIYISLNGTVESELNAVKRAVKADPDAGVAAFVSAEDALLTEGGTASTLSAWLDAREETLYVVAVAHGAWGYDGSFTADDAALWDEDSFAAQLGDVVTPGKNYLLLLSGEDSPYADDTAFTQDAAPAADLADALFIVSE